MATTKKAAKTKKTTAKKAVKKTAAAHKATKKTAAAHKATKKVEHKEETHKSPVSHKKESNETFKMAAIIAGVVLVVLAIVYALLVFMPASDVAQEPKEKNSTTPNTTTSSQSVTLTVIEDPTCASCQVDVFTQEVKTNLIPEMEIQKIDANSEEGKALLESLDLIQVPAYVFSKNIDERDDWATQLAGAFLPVSINGENQYLLNPAYVPTKVLIAEPVITETATIIGDVNAPVTVIEFSDYECPFCGIAEGNEELVAQFSAQSPGYQAPIPNVMKDYVEQGLVRIVFYNMPLESLHPKVMPVHLAALCAKEQGSFDEFHKKIFADRSQWVESSDYSAKMKEFAAEFNLDQTQFDECLDSQKYLSQIQEELALGQQYGVSGTPAFFVGKTFLSGAQDYSTFKAAIDSELAALE